MSAKQADKPTADKPSEGPHGAGAPSGPDPKPAEAKLIEPGPGEVAVTLLPGGPVATFLDPATHLRVTRERQIVPARRVGEATRRHGYVRIEEHHA